MKPSRPIHIAASGRISLFAAKYHSIVCTYITFSLFIHPLMDTYVIFHVLADVNNAALNMGCTSVCSHQQCTGFLFLHVLKDTCYFYLFDDSSLWVWFAFPYWLVFLSLFSFSWWLLKYLLWNTVCVFRSFAQLRFVGFFFFFFFFAAELYEFLVYFGYQPLSDMWFLNIFSHFTGYLFIMLISLVVQMLCQFDVPFFFFFFVFLGLHP